MVAVMNSEEQHPESTDVAVLGATLAGLVVARDLARRGYRVTVIEERDAPCGSAGALVLGTATVSARPEGFVDETGVIAELAAELGLAMVRPQKETASIRLPGRTFPMPENTVLGVPGAPLAKDVIDVLGWGAALRAYADRVRPVLKIGRYNELGSLVRGRMGSVVVDRLLEPVTRAVFGKDPSSLAVADAIPELNGAITRSGSLSGAVSMLRTELDSNDTYVTRDIEGGLHGLLRALMDDAVDYHAELRFEAVVDLAAHDDEGWLLTLTNGEQLRAQAIVNADSDVYVPDRVALRSENADFADFPYSRIFVAPAEQQVEAIDLQLVSSVWSQGKPEDSVLMLSYLGGDDTANDSLAEQAVRDAETLLGIRIGTPIAAVQTANRSTRPALVDGEGVHKVAAGVSLSEIVRSSREIAAAIRRDDFAVAGVSWTEQVTGGAEETGTTENEETS